MREYQPSGGRHTELLPIVPSGRVTLDWRGARKQVIGKARAVRGNAARLISSYPSRSMEGGSVGEFLDVTVERLVLDQL